MIRRKGGYVHIYSNYVNGYVIWYKYFKYNKFYWRFTHGARNDGYLRGVKRIIRDWGT